MTIFISKVVSIHTKKTCLRLTSVEWEALNIICCQEKLTRKMLLEKIDDCRNKNFGLTTAVRTLALSYFLQPNISSFTATDSHNLQSSLQKLQ